MSSKESSLNLRKKDNLSLKHLIWLFLLFLFLEDIFKMRDIEDDPDAETIQNYMARMTKVLFYLSLLKEWSESIRTK